MSSHLYNNLKTILSKVHHQIIVQILRSSIKVFSGTEKPTKGNGGYNFKVSKNLPEKS